MKLVLNEDQLEKINAPYRTFALINRFYFFVQTEIVTNGPLKTETSHANFRKIGTATMYKKGVYCPPAHF